MRLRVFTQDDSEGFVLRLIDVSQPQRTIRFPAPAGFHTTTAHDEDTFVLSLYGELDVCGGEDIERACAHALRAGQPQIVVDLGALSYIDSTGLRALLALSRQAQARHVRLLILPGPAQVQRAFDMGGVRRAFTFADDA